MKIAVIGGSIGGLTAALFLARAGHEVVVLESDDAPAPETMSGDQIWFRRGTPHGRQAHNFMPGFVRAMREHAPDVLDAIVAGGAIERRVDELLPSTVRDRSPHPGDEEMVVVNARRPYVEWHLRLAALRESRVTFRSGSHVREPIAKTFDGAPHVVGVRTDDGEEILADVTIDAAGRRTQIDRWLTAMGARPAAYIEEPCHEVYLGRWYRLTRTDDLPPLNFGYVAHSPTPFSASLVFPGDNDVVQLAVGCLPEDEPLKAGLRDPRAFHAVASVMPAVRDWVAPDRSEPLTPDVGTMAGLYNCLRRLVVDGAPVVTGLHLVGDSWAITNPQYGRGVSHAAISASVMVEVLDAHADDPRAQALALDAEASRMLEPSVRHAMTLDRARTESWRAGLRGEDPPASEAPTRMAKVARALATDPVVWRASFRGTGVLDPPGSWTRDPDVMARVDATEPEPSPPAADMPTRARILEAISSAG